MPKPLEDLVNFLTADTPDYAALGAARFVVVLCFYGLIVGSLMLLAVNLRQDRAQRSGTLLWLWAVRVLTGCMWFQAVLWTLPFGADNGLRVLTERAAERAAFPALASFASDTLLAHFGSFDALAFLLAFAFAAALMLGLFARLAGLGSLAAGAALWLGLYDRRPDDPAGWAWGYVFLALVGGTLAVLAAGRAGGADAWLRRNVPAVRDRRAAGLPLRLLT